MLRITFNKYLNVQKKKDEKISKSGVEGNILCTEQKKIVSVEGNIYKCKEGAIISFLLVCDGKADCQNDMSDEEHCDCEETRDNHVFHLCKNVNISPNKTSCSPFYKSTLNKSCEKFLPPNDTETMNLPVHPDLFVCSNSTSINNMLTDDLAADCGPHGEDEMHLLLLLTNRNYFPCTNTNDVPCREVIQDVTI